MPIVLFAVLIKVALDKCNNIIRSICDIKYAFLLCTMIACIIYYYIFNRSSLMKVTFF